MPRQCYIVSVQVFACDGEDIEVIAESAAEAEAKAKRIAENRHLAKDHYDYSLQEVCISSVNLDPGDPQRYERAIDPALYDWVPMAKIEHPLPEGTLMLSVNGECDEGDHGERATGPMAVGVIERVDHYPGRGWAYGTHFTSGDAPVYVTIDEGEYAPTGTDPDAYLIAI